MHIGSALARRASETRQTALLVDADQHIRLEDDLANALLTLDREGKFVRTTVFGAFSDRTRQRLSTSPKLRQYCQYGKDFHVREVPRLGNEGQPNDEAIIHEVRMLSEQSIQVECIALLVSDGDFALAVQDAVSHGKEVVVFVPEMNPAVEKVFQSTGARVVRLPPHTASEARASKIRATLKAEGTGYIKTTGPVLYKQLDSSSMRDFLSHFSYCAPDARPDLLCPAMAKFWFTNKLGDAFTVYPYQAAVLDLKRMLIEHHGRQWEPYQQNLAFFLPTKGGRRPSKEARENYGPGFGPSVHEGGGPFMLNDSDNLVSEALQKLGFLDQDLNSDFGSNACLLQHVEQQRRITSHGFTPLLGFNCAAEPAASISLLIDRNVGGPTIRRASAHASGAERVIGKRFNEQAAGFLDHEILCAEPWTA